MLGQDNCNINIIRRRNSWQMDAGDLTLDPQHTHQSSEWLLEVVQNIQRFQTLRQCHGSNCSPEENESGRRHRSRARRATRMGQTSDLTEKVQETHCCQWHCYFQQWMRQLSLLRSHIPTSQSRVRSGLCIGDVPDTWRTSPVDSDW